MRRSKVYALLRLISAALLLASAAKPLRAGSASAIPDARIAVVLVQDDQPIELVVSPGRDLDVLMPAGEQITSVLVSDTEGLHASVPDAQDGLVLNVAHSVINAGVTVRTAAHTYAFHVTGASSLPSPTWVVQLKRPEMPPSMQTWTPPQVVAPGKYRLSGDKALLPSSIRDDGVHVFIEWPANQALPAVFGIGATGGEEMVDGYMRSGTFVIDRVYPALVFRIDRAEARAQRETEKAKR